MVERRVFLVTMASAACAAACGGGDATGTGGADVPGTRRIPLMAVGVTVGIANFGPGGQGIAVTRIADAAVIAVSRRCTHAGCTVSLPNGPGANMACPCHGSLYTPQGAVLNGPAVNPLASFSATIDATTSEVVITIA